MSKELFERFSCCSAQASIPAQDRITFYGLTLISPLIWWVELASLGSLWLLVAANLVFSAWQLWKAWQDDNARRQTNRTPSSFENRIDTMAPLVCGVVWMSLIWMSATPGSDSLSVFVLLSALMLLAIMPFGIIATVFFSVPVLLVANGLILDGSWENRIRTTLLLNTTFMVFVYVSARLTRLNSHSESPSETREVELLMQEIETQRESICQAEKIRLDLEHDLAMRERDRELTIRERTKELRDANTQLSQQIALRKTIGDALVKSQTRLTQAIDASHLGLIDWDVAQGQFYQSAFHKLFGDKEQSSELVIQTLKSVIHPADYIEVRDTLNACLKGERMEYVLQYRVVHEDDNSSESWLWIEECAKVVDSDAKGQAARILGTRRNIQSEVSRDEQVRLAKSVFDHTSEGVFVLDHNAHFLSVNPAYSEITGRSSKRLVGHAIQAVSETPQKEEVYTQLFKEVAEHGRWQGELLEKRHHGDYFPQWMQINAILDERGAIKYYAGLVSDLSDRKAADEKLDYLLNYDDLTKLANRIQFKDQLHRALLRYKDQQVPFALVLIDIDRFKQFNDSFGHDESDSLLCSVAERLSKSVQKVDILARVGGNEFACIVACSPTFDIHSFAQRLFLSVTQGHYEVAGQEVVLSCSIGVAQVPENTQDFETLMQFGALAVQKAKYQGGGRVQLFDESLKSFSRQRMEIEQELRKALSQQELEVYYQPKLDLAQERITSLEALIRWNHPVRGFISPEEFVNIAEESGLISELGSYVLQTACDQTQQWAGKGLGQLNVSVNLSPRQLRETGLRELVSATLEATHIPAENLELELTESAIMEDTKGAIALLHELQMMGIKISVDDFGTGYSSLSYLKELPVNTLKIDRSFIDGVEDSKSQKAIVKAIIVLGDSLGLQIVAEGVENDAQLELLQHYGCDLIQGYLVSKPLNVADMEQMLTQQKKTTSLPTSL